MNCFSRVVSIICYISSNSLMKIRVYTQTTFFNSLQSSSLSVFCRMLLNPSMADLNIETAYKATWFLIKYNTYLEGSNCNVYP